MTSDEPFMWVGQEHCVLVNLNLHSQVVAVAARKLEDAQEFARKHSISRAYGGYEELARDPDIGESQSDPRRFSQSTNLNPPVGLPLISSPV